MYTDSRPKILYTITQHIVVVQNRWEMTTHTDIIVPPPLEYHTMLVLILLDRIKQFSSGEVMGYHALFISPREPSKPIITLICK